MYFNKKFLGGHLYERNVRNANRRTIDRHKSHAGSCKSCCAKRGNAISGGSQSIWRRSNNGCRKLHRLRKKKNKKNRQAKNSQHSPLLYWQRRTTKRVFICLIFQYGWQHPSCSRSLWQISQQEPAAPVWIFSMDVQKQGDGKRLYCVLHSLFPPKKHAIFSGICRLFFHWTEWKQHLYSIWLQQKMLWHEIAETLLPLFHQKSSSQYKRPPSRYKGNLRKVPWHRQEDDALRFFPLRSAEFFFPGREIQHGTYSDHICTWCRIGTVCDAPHADFQQRHKAADPLFQQECCENGTAPRKGWNRYPERPQHYRRWQKKNRNAAAHPNGKWQHGLSAP